MLLKCPALLLHAAAQLVMCNGKGLGKDMTIVDFPAASCSPVTASSCTRAGPRLFKRFHSSGIWSTALFLGAEVQVVEA